MEDIKEWTITVEGQAECQECCDGEIIRADNCMCGKPYADFKENEYHLFAMGGKEVSCVIQYWSSDPAQFIYKPNNDEKE